MAKDCICADCTGQPHQMTFDEVVESERIPGDEEYTEWIKSGKGRIDAAVARARWKKPHVTIEHLPSL